MNTKPMPCINRALLLVATLMGAVNFAGAQITNWVAYNDHRPTTAPVASGWRITAPNVTGYDMGAPADLPASALTDFRTGNPLAATVSFTRTGGPDDFGAVGRPIRTNTPMARIFYGICDLSNDGLIGVRAVPPNTAESYVTATFGGLDPAKRYVFRGSIARNGGYGTRWSVATIAADGWTDAHINGDGGPGVLTINSFPASALNPGQAAWNSGGNNEGAVVGWNDIVPLADGTFTITCNQYTGAIPGGVANGPYGYSFGAMMLAEVEIVAPAITANPAASTTVEQNRPFSLSVAATGAPLNYQWYKEGLGEVPGATFPTYSVAQAQVSDSGMYYAVVYNSLARRTSTVAQVTVFADTTAPTVETIFSYPTVDAVGVATLNQIIIEFSEPVVAASVDSPARYTVPGGGNPTSVIVTNERSVVLVLGTPMAEDTDFSVTLSGARDAVGNVAGSSSAPFHSWVSGIGNGLLMESYTVEDASAAVESLFADPDYPNNPDRRDTLRAFDTRLVYPDDSREGYGARIRGVFIPPVSGDWRFFARTPVLGILFLNPNGTDEAGKVEIVRQSTQNAPYPWDRLRSSLVPLRAGRAYYIEGTYKNATGADYFKVAARLAGTGVPTPVDSPDTDAPDANSLAGAAVAFPLAPRNLGGPLTLVQDVQNITAEENHPATFAIQVSDSSGLPIFYQWFRDDVLIAGANGPSYSFQVTGADSGATFRVQAAKIGAVTNSRTATLTVVPDTNGPVLLSVKGDDTFSKITLTWDETILPDAAQEPGSYKILAPNMTEIPVINATLTNGSTVILTLAGRMQPSTTYSVEAGFQADPIGNPTVKVGNPVVDPLHGVVKNLRSFVITPGLARFQAYTGLSSAGTLDSFLTSAVYPDGATFSFYTNVVNWPQSAPNIDQYVMRLTGLFVAPENGLHVFDLSHDDDARLRVFASDDPNDATFTELVEPGVSAFGADGTVSVTLVAGQRYYYELIVREFGGADYAGLEVTLPSAAVISPIAAQYLEAAVEPSDVTPTQPQLTARRGNGTLVITWPGSFTTFILETAPIIPSATWTPVNSTVVNGENTAIIPIPASGNALSPAAAITPTVGANTETGPDASPASFAFRAS